MKLSKVLGRVLAVGAVAGGAAGIAYYSKKSVDKAGELEGRYKAYYQLTNQWIANHNEGKDIGKYFEENNIKSIAVYGIGTLCELFYSEIKKTNVKVEYFIDKNAEELYVGMDDITVVGIDEIADEKEVDAVIVTPVYDFDEIMDTLDNEGYDLNLISLEDVIYGI